MATAQTNLGLFYMHQTPDRKNMLQKYASVQYKRCFITVQKKWIKYRTDKQLANKQLLQME
jgi:hypothetical protein